MKKTDFKNIKLTKGEINLYQAGSVALRVYKTNDPINDMTLILSKDKRAVVIEPPCFVENIVELEEHLNTLDFKVEGLVLAYHMNGVNFIKEVKRYSTKNAEEFGSRGMGKTILENFVRTFGNAIDGTINRVTDYIDLDWVSIAGIIMNIERTNDAFDIEIPEINVKYIHMLGHDVHSIIGSVNHLDAEITKLTGCAMKGYDLILTSHYLPEDMDDVKEKIAYLKQLRSAAASAVTAGEFTQIMKTQYPTYGGDNYLDMTAKALFRM